MQDGLAKAARQARLVPLRAPGDVAQVGLECTGDREELVDVAKQVIGLERRDDGGRAALGKVAQRDGVILRGVPS